MEGRRPTHVGRFLPARLLITISFGTLFALVWPSPAFAGNTESQNTTTASAAASGGTIDVQAGGESWTPPPGSPWAQRAQSDPPPGKPDPNQPYGCKYYAAPAGSNQTLGVGGATPGQWVFPVCAGPGVIDPMPPIWVSNAQAAAVPALSPAVVAQQALSKLPLPSPGIEMAPPANQDQLVNVSTWLWIDSGSWQRLSATATAGPVSATASAVPAEVVWQMGNGNSVTCHGPGTPYDSSNPNATTSCSYTWSQSSAGEPGGVYQVTATVYYQVTWTAAGAPGGGNLGLVAGPSAHVAVRVAESQAINSTPGN